MGCPGLRATWRPSDEATKPGRVAVGLAHDEPPVGERGVRAVPEGDTLHIRIFKISNTISQN